MNKTKLILLLIIACVSAIGYLYLNRCIKISCIEIENKELFIMQQIYQDDKYTYKALMRKDNQILRIQVNHKLDANAAKQIINSNISSIKALYDNTFSPYPGVISKEITCTDEFKPDYSLNDDITKLTKVDTYLNQNLTIGVCNQQQITYRTLIRYLYCPDQKQLYNLELIVPMASYSAKPEAYNQTADSIRCK